MIEVYIKYIHKITTTTRTDYFIFPSFIVKGHANNGNSSLDCVKVCAGVSACVIGIRRLLDDCQYIVNFNKGLFEIKHKFSIKNDDAYCDMDTCYALNTLWCQLFDLYKLYPSQFKCFIVEEVKQKENELIYERNTNNPKPFRELNLDIHGNKKRLHRKKNGRIFIN